MILLRLTKTLIFMLSLHTTCSPHNPDTTVGLEPCILAASSTDSLDMHNISKKSDGTTTEQLLAQNDVINSDSTAISIHLIQPILDFIENLNALLDEHLQWTNKWVEAFKILARPVSASEGKGVFITKKLREWVDNEGPNLGCFIQTIFQKINEFEMKLENASFETVQALSSYNDFTEIKSKIELVASKYLRIRLEFVNFLIKFHFHEFKNSESDFKKKVKKLKDLLDVPEYGNALGNIQDKYSRVHDGKKTELLEEVNI